MATVQEVLDEVGTDPDKARVALAHEMESASPRSTLVEALQAVVGSDSRVGGVRGGTDEYAATPGGGSPGYPTDQYAEPTKDGAVDYPTDKYAE